MKTMPVRRGGYGCNKTQNAGDDGYRDPQPLAVRPQLGAFAGPVDASDLQFPVLRDRTCRAVCGGPPASNGAEGAGRITGTTAIAASGNVWSAACSRPGQNPT